MIPYFPGIRFLPVAFVMMLAALLAWAELAYLDEVQGGMSTDRGKEEEHERDGKDHRGGL